MERRCELESLRRSVAMLTPGAHALRREDALRLLTELADVQERLDALKTGLRAPHRRLSAPLVTALSPLSLAGYAVVVRHVLPVLGRHQLATITRGDVDALCAALELAPSTVSTVHQHFGQLLASAVDDGLIARNPATRARLPKREATRARPVPLHVIDRIAHALPDWMRVVVPLGVGVGLRQGELSGLTVDRVDFLRRTLRVDRQLVTRQVPEPTLAPAKTSSSNRTVPLTSFVVDAMADHLRRFPAGPGDFFVRSPEGLPLDSDRFGQQWRRACKAAGASGVGYHALRHTFASTLLSRGVSVKAVADWLGHGSPVVTLSTYAHLMPQTRTSPGASSTLRWESERLKRQPRPPKREAHGYCWFFSIRSCDWLRRP